MVEVVGGRGNQDQLIEMVEIRCMIENLLVQVLQQWELVRTCMDIPKGNHESWDIPENCIEDENDDIEEKFLS